MPSLNALAQHRWADRMRSLWRWWTGELTDMLPVWVTDRRFSAPTCAIRIDRTSVEVERIADGIGERFRDDRPIDSHDAESWVQLARLIGDYGVRLIVAFPDAHTVKLELPAAAAARLKAAIGLQLVHAAPVDPDELYWSYSAVEGSSNGIAATVSMARRERLDALAALFEANGIPAPPIYAEVDNAEVLLRPGGSSAVDRDRLVNRRAALVALALLTLSPFATLAAAEFVIWRTKTRADTLQMALKPQLATARELLSNEALRGALRPLTQLPAISETVEEFAVRLPPTAYLVQLERGSDQKLRFMTESADGAEEIGKRLEGAALLSSAEVRDQSMANDRIRTHFESGGR